MRQEYGGSRGGLSFPLPSKMASKCLNEGHWVFQEVQSGLEQRPRPLGPRLFLLRIPWFCGREKTPQLIRHSLSGTSLVAPKIESSLCKEIVIR